MLTCCFSGGQVQWRPIKNEHRTLQSDESGENVYFNIFVNRHCDGVVTVQSKAGHGVMPRLGGLVSSRWSFLNIWRNRLLRQSREYNANAKNGFNE